MKKKILVVEDDSAIRELISEILEMEGFSVESAKNGREALRKISELERKSSVQDVRKEYAGIVSDIDMPEMSGIEFAKEMEKRGRYFPILFISGNPMNKERLKDLKQTGNYSFLGKPFTIKNFYAVSKKLFK